MADKPHQLKGSVLIYDDNYFEVNSEGGVRLRTGTGIPTGALPLYDGGRPSTGFIYFSGAGTVDGNTITINSRIYEFDTDSAITGDVAVDISAGGNPAQSAAAFLAALNADTSRVVNAANMLGTTEGVLLIDMSTTPGSNYTLARSGANITLSGAAMTGGVAAAQRQVEVLSHTISAAEITLRNLAPADNYWLIGGVKTTTAPTVVGVLARDVSGNAYDPANLIITLAQHNSAEYSVVMADPGSILSATDVVTVIAFV